MGDFMTIQRARLVGMLLLAALALSACGFHLRGSDGSYNLPFATLFITLP